MKRVITLLTLKTLSKLSGSKNSECPLQLQTKRIEFTQDIFLPPCVDLMINISLEGSEPRFWERSWDDGRNRRWNVITTNQIILFVYVCVKRMHKLKSREFGNISYRMQNCHLWAPISYTFYILFWVNKDKTSIL